MSKKIREGKWIRLATMEEANERAKKANWSGHCDVLIIKDNWTGPGLYMECTYQKRCPRGCCYDSVYEIIAANEVAYEVSKEMRELAEILKKARSNDH